MNDQSTQSRNDEWSLAFHSLTANPLTESFIFRFDYVHRELTVLLYHVRNMPIIDEVSLNLAPDIIWLKIPTISYLLKTADVTNSSKINVVAITEVALVLEEYPTWDHYANEDAPIDPSKPPWILYYTNEYAHVFVLMINCWVSSFFIPSLIFLMNTSHLLFNSSVLNIPKHSSSLFSSSLVIKSISYSLCKVL
ncbi:hypothetical protein RJ641_017147 [Dillenia turbinata]|uniref:Uncharacterized protein n=1 Tax=Dillenia turbinata TaxID=194707 RepID=A0AAN8UNE0_9MAGN